MAYEELFNSIMGRVNVAPLKIPDREEFIRFLEKSATRVDSRLKLEVPLLSRSKGLVFFENGRSVLIRYNSAKRFGFISTCYYSGKFQQQERWGILRGCFRFPWYFELQKYLILIVLAVWLLYFPFAVLRASTGQIEELVIFAGGLLVLGAGTLLLGNVRISSASRNTMKVMRDLLATYANQASR